MSAEGTSGQGPQIDEDVPPFHERENPTAERRNFSGEISEDIAAASGGAIRREPKWGMGLAFEM